MSRIIEEAVVVAVILDVTMGGALGRLFWAVLS